MIRSRFNSFKFAFQGLYTLFKEQPNARIHLVCSILVIFLGFLFGINKTDWTILILVILLVLITEGINTAIEYLCDKTTTEIDPLIKKSKDVAAASVLLSTFGAVIIGIIIFSSYI